MGISRDHLHKRRATGGKRAPIRNKRKFELGRPAAMTKLGQQRIHTVRCRGGNKKYRALRLDTGNFSWGSESIARKTRIIDVAYNACNNELVRTKTLVKNAIVVIDATPFRQWWILFSDFETQNRSLWWLILEHVRLLNCNEASMIGLIWIFSHLLLRGFSGI